MEKQNRFLIAERQQGDRYVSETTENLLTPFDLHRISNSPQSCMCGNKSKGCAEAVVTNQDLQLTGEGILANINGSLYSVNSLKRAGSQWLVNYDLHNPHRRCSWGHSPCGYCHMYHKRVCPDYIPRCSALQ